MNQILALLFPSAYGTLIYAKNTKSEMKDVVLTYMINVTLTNAMCYLFMYHMYNIKSFNFTNLFTLKYTLASTIISIIFGIILTIVDKTLSFKVDVTKSEKKEVKSEIVKEEPIKKIEQLKIEDTIENNKSIIDKNKKKENKKKEVKNVKGKKSIKNNK